MVNRKRYAEGLFEVCFGSNDGISNWRQLEMKVDTVLRYLKLRGCTVNGHCLTRIGHLRLSIRLGRFDENDIESVKKLAMDFYEELEEAFKNDEIGPLNVEYKGCVFIDEYV